ncbi:hypothetical protein IAT40_005734 [Kwoniella sp. CBS 6097]
MLAQSTPFPGQNIGQGLGPYAHGRPSGINSDVGSVQTTGPHLELHFPSSSAYHQSYPPNQPEFTMVPGGTKPEASYSDMPMTNTDLNQLFNSFGQAAIDTTTTQTQIVDPTMASILPGPWQDLSFEALLNSSFSPWDSSAYESMGQMETTAQAPLPDETNHNIPTLYALDIPIETRNTPIQPSFQTDPQPARDSAEMPVDFDCGDQADLLLKFYEAYIIPAWSCTYPPGVRERIVQRHRDVCSAHRLANICRLAVSATYIHLIQRDRRQRHLARSQRDSRLDNVPAYYTDKWVDPEPILTQATLLVRSPKDVNLTVEAHLWALSDLHMAVTAYCEGAHANAVMKIAQQVFQVAYGDHPEFDIESKHGHYSWNLMVFPMIDLNHSLYSREPTWFKFGVQSQNRHQRHLADMPFINDGSHDNWFGLPASLITILARILNGIAEYTPDPNLAPRPIETTAAGAGGDSDAAAVPVSVADSRRLEGRTKLANRCLRELFTWRSPWSVVDIGVPRHPIEFAAEFAVEAEIWRHLCIVLVLTYIAVDLDVAQQTRLQDSINLDVDLLASLHAISVPRIKIQSPTIDFWSSFYTTPAFIVGSLLMKPKEVGNSSGQNLNSNTDAESSTVPATTTTTTPTTTIPSTSTTWTTAQSVLHQRQIIRDMLMRQGPERAVEEMIMLLEVIWTSSDENGVVADWHQEAKKAGIDLIFF